MNSQPSHWLVMLVGVLAVCCCLAGAGGVWAVRELFADPTFSTVAGVVEGPAPDSDAAAPQVRSGRAPTYTPEARGEPAATTVRVSPALAGGNYGISVPTPIPPKMAHPVKVNSRLTVANYSVSGTSIEALTRSLQASALTDPHEPTRRYYARTDWHMAANWELKPTVSGCRVDRGEITIVMTMTLPVLVSQMGLASDVLTRWNAFIANTVEHEKGHVALNLNGAHDYQDALGNYASVGNCDTLSTALASLFKTHFAAVDRSNVEYDAVTDHGASQGAVFP